MFKHKKGAMFGVLSSIVLVIFVLGVIAAMRTKLDKFEKTIGEDQLELAEFYDKAQRAPFFITRAAKFAGEKSVYELGFEGGFFNPQCNSYHSYALWQTETKACYPDPKTGFKVIFQKHLDEYLKEYPDAVFPLSNYYLYITGKEKIKIQGNAMKYMTFFPDTNLINILAESETKEILWKLYESLTEWESVVEKLRELGIETNIVYALRPSFTAELDYDIGVYDLLKAESKKLISDVIKCEKIQKSLDTCVEDAKRKANSNLIENGLAFASLNECGAYNDPEQDRVFKFCVKTKDTVLVYNEEDETYENKNIMIRFALYMVDLPPEKVKVSLFDHRKATRSIVVRWSKAEDAEAYNIYFSKAPFSGKTIQNGQIPGTENIKIRNIGSAEKIDYIDLTRCNPSIYEKACAYGDYNKPLIRDKLYFVEGEDSYLYVVDGVDDGIEYYFGVTGIDISGNENAELVSGKNYDKGRSVST
jgi:hypothetical protein